MAALTLHTPKNAGPGLQHLPPDRTATEMASLIVSGRAQLTEIRNDGRLIGAMILGRESGAAGEWLIVHTLQCEPVAGMNMTDWVAGRLSALCRETGLAGFRCWTRRSGLKRKLEQMGAQSHFVLEVRV